MTRMNAEQVRWCENCQQWFTLKDRTSMELERCPECGEYPRMAKCNRCGREWKISSSRYPSVCVQCKSPYFNRERVHTR